MFAVTTSVDQAGLASVDGVSRSPGVPNGKLRSYYRKPALVANPHKVVDGGRAETVDVLTLL